MAYSPPFGMYPVDDMRNHHHPGDAQVCCGHHFHVVECRCSPAEMPYHEHRPDLGGGWWQGGSKLKNFKPRYYLTRPRDGKRSGGLGRLKDALSGEGPDVFVTISGDRRTLMKDRPQKWQWSGWGMTPSEQWRAFNDRDRRLSDEMPIVNTRWTGRRTNQGYNFRTRKYETLNARIWTEGERRWTDAHWRPGAKWDDKLPLSRRDICGNWETRVPWSSGHYAGGRSRFV